MLPSVAAFSVTDLNAATFVAYKADGSVDYEGVDAHCADLAKHKVPFAFSECGCGGGGGGGARAGWAEPAPRAGGDPTLSVAA